MSDLRQSVPIGSHKAIWTPDGGSEIDLGLTKEGCTIEIETDGYERTADELAALYDERVDKVSITGEIELIEVDIDMVATCLGLLKTTVAGPPSKASVDMNPLRGYSKPFGKLVFHPRKLADAVVTDDKTIWNAIVAMSGNRIFKAAEDGSLKFSFKAGAYWDSTLSKWRIYTEGDPTTGVGFEL